MANNHYFGMKILLQIVQSVQYYHIKLCITKAIMICLKDYFRLKKEQKDSQYKLIKISLI